MSLLSRTWLCCTALLCASLELPAQPSAGKQVNLTMEQLAGEGQLPLGWAPGIRQGAAPLDAGYQAQADGTVYQEGHHSLRIASGAGRLANTFGAVCYKLPGTYKGRTITLKGYLKTQDVQQGFAGLWMRLDGAEGSLQFDNMQDTNLSGTHNWQQYSITLPLSAQVEHIYIGGILAGAGTVWLDNLAVTIDDTPLASVKPNALFKAQTDTSFQHGSRIALGKLTPQQVENLTVLGQVWGFVKYYHPAVASGNYNWDKELFRVMPAVLASKNEPERSRVLGTWLAGLAPVTTPAVKRVPKDQVQLEPALGWLSNSKLLSQDLQRQLMYLRDHPAKLEHYYVGQGKAGNATFLHEEAYADMSYPDAGYRLLALFRYWNMIEYFFPYKYAIGEDWQTVLKEFIPQFADAPDALQYRLAALRLIERVHDTHANLWGKDKIMTDYWGIYTVPAELQFLGKQPVVAKLRQTGLAAPSPLQPGDIITSVDGVTVADWIQQRQLLFPASNEPTRLRNVAAMLLRGSTRTARLGIVRNGEARIVEAERVSITAMNTPRGTAADSSYRFLRPDVGYITLGQIQNKQLPAIMSAFQNTKGLVIDIRNYPSEFVVFTLSAYLLEKPTPFVKFTGPSLPQPGQFIYGKPVYVKPGNKPTYQGKVIILVNEQTQSQAEYTTMALRTAPRATVLGSTTAGADGNVSYITLPGNLSTMISGLGVYYPDGRETQRIGIIPDVEAHPTLKGIRESRDELVEKALELIDKS
ncbi:S41 family peptidase [Hymenobacter fodinae]|uniref:Peptidase S41 n=1 Tax=Hymenobacter fodinae TaxID=2510796 RepID=A0A4Z0P7N6_9BACT|nr:S41 family peptidase [Hymenobacter fodinae]TGE07968.1 peptidase S41 [Hymenobacter fodinae]